MISEHSIFVRIANGALLFGVGMTVFAFSMIWFADDIESDSCFARGVESQIGWLIIDLPLFILCSTIVVLLRRGASVGSIVHWISLICISAVMFVMAWGGIRSLWFC